jgi:hypothetical protein
MQLAPIPIVLRELFKGETNAVGEVETGSYLLLVVTKKNA